MAEDYGVRDVATLRAVIDYPHPLVEKKIIDRLDEVGAGFVRAAPFVLLATADAEGRADVSPRGEAPSGVWIKDDRTLYLAERHGNKLAMSLQNIIANPSVGLMFMIPGVDECYRVQGQATITRDPAILQRLEARGKLPLLAIEIRIGRCYLHCGKAIKRSRLWHADARMKFDFRFGSTIAREAGGGTEMEKMVNDIIEDDYRTNL